MLQSWEWMREVEVHLQGEWMMLSLILVRELPAALVQLILPQMWAGLGDLQLVDLEGGLKEVDRGHWVVERDHFLEALVDDLLVQVEGDCQVADHGPRVQEVPVDGLLVRVDGLLDSRA